MYAHREVWTYIRTYVFIHLCAVDCTLQKHSNYIHACILCSYGLIFKFIGGFSCVEFPCSLYVTPVVFDSFNLTHLSTMLHICMYVHANMVIHTMQTIYVHVRILLLYMARAYF